MGRVKHWLGVGVWGIVLSGGIGIAEDVDYVYRDRFEQGTNAPTGWEKQGLAEWDSCGRTGRSLRISTWHREGTASQWTSPLIEVVPGTHNLGAWAALPL